MSIEDWVYAARGMLGEIRRVERRTDVVVLVGLIVAAIVVWSAVAVLALRQGRSEGAEDGSGVVAGLDLAEAGEVGAVVGSRGIGQVGVGEVREHPA